MNNKSNKKKWFDIKSIIAALGFLITMWLWSAFSKDLVKTSLAQVTPANNNSSGITAVMPAVPGVQPTPFTRILMGGSAPQLFQAAGNSAPQPITQTSSSK
jgi:hypothetical protein